MKTSRMVMLACLALLTAASAGFTRTLLGRKMYYTTVPAGKISEARYWFVYLGQHECTLERKFPGEEVQQVTGNMNLSLLSSGYSAKGKLDCVPTMKIKTDSGVHTITIDSIDCLFSYGKKVRTVNGAVGDFVIDIEGEPKRAKRFLLTEYKMTRSVDGERELKKAGDDIPLSAIATSREGAARAIKAMSAPPAAKPASPPPASR
jgi:hypothetical protein